MYLPGALQLRLVLLERGDALLEGRVRREQVGKHGRADLAGRDGQRRVLVPGCPAGGAGDLLDVHDAAAADVGVRDLASIDRLLVLHNGAFIAEGDPATVLRSPQVAEIYLGIEADA